MLKHGVFRDITSPGWIIAKGCLFVVLGVMASGLLIGAVLWEVVPFPPWQRVVLHVVAVWSFCRGYYFAFYVIEKYVDPGYRFAGLWSAVRWVIWGRRE